MGSVNQLSPSSMPYSPSPQIQSPTSSSIGVTEEVLKKAFSRSPASDSINHYLNGMRNQFVGLKNISASDSINLSKLEDNLNKLQSLKGALETTNHLSQQGAGVGELSQQLSELSEQVGTLIKTRRRYLNTLSQGIKDLQTIFLPIRNKLGTDLKKYITTDDIYNIIKCLKANQATVNKLQIALDNNRTRNPNAIKNRIEILKKTNDKTLSDFGELVLAQPDKNDDEISNKIKFFNSNNASINKLKINNRNRDPDAIKNAIATLTTTNDKILYGLVNLVFEKLKLWDNWYGLFPPKSPEQINISKNNNPFEMRNSLHLLQQKIHAEIQTLRDRSQTSPLSLSDEARLKTLFSALEGLKYKQEQLYIALYEIVPDSTRKLINDTQKIMGSDFQIPIDQRMGLIEMLLLDSGSYEKAYQEVLVLAQQFKNETLEDLSKGNEPFNFQKVEQRAAALNTELEVSIAGALAAEDHEELSRAMRNLYFDLSGKVCGHVNTQFLTDSMGIAPHVNEVTKDKPAEKLCVALEVTFKRYLAVLARIQFESQYLPGNSRSRASEGLEFSEVRNSYTKIEWYPERNQEGRLQQIKLKGFIQFARRLDDVNLEREITASLNYSAFGLKSTQQEDAAWALICTQFNTARPFPEPVEDCQKIPKEYRGLVSHPQADQAFWENPATDAELVKAVLKEYNAILELMKPEVEAFVNHVNRSIVKAFIEEPQSELVSPSHLNEESDQKAKIVAQQQFHSTGQGA